MPCGSGVPAIGMSQPSSSRTRAPAGEHRADRRRSAAGAARAARAAPPAAQALGEQEEAEVAAGMHAGGRAEAHRRGQQQQGHRLGPAGRIVEHVAGEHLPALHHGHPDQRDGGRW